MAIYSVSMGMTWLLAAVLSTPAVAQLGTAAGSISCMVTDTVGGAIPAAHVTVREDATRTETSFWTSSEGTFSGGTFAPGDYTVTVSLSGFKTFVMTNVVVRLGTRTELRAILEVGNPYEFLKQDPGPRDCRMGCGVVNLDQIRQLGRPSHRPVDLPVYVIR